MIFSVGETSWGFPHGVTVDELRRDNEQSFWHTPWAVAKRSLHRALVYASGGADRIDVDYVEFIARGRRRLAFAADVNLAPDPDRHSGRYLALVPRAPIDLDYLFDVAHEARILDWVAPRIDLRVPRPLAVIDPMRAPILVETLVAGLGLDLRAGRLPRGHPSDLIAEAAAAVHRVELPPADLLSPRDRTQHRLELFHELFDDHEDFPPAVLDARAWMLQHLERPGPGALLHGALLGPHLRHRAGEAIGLLGWDDPSIGDPAHDLALATDARRRPFGSIHGRPRLLAAYDARSAHEVTSDDLRFFELALLIERHFTSDSPQHAHAIAGLLRGSHPA